MINAIIIQARLGSTRLPRKVLLDLAGETVIGHVLKRSAEVPGIDVVCCAIPDTAQSDALAAEVRRHGVEVVRGSENDVLDRFYRAALAVKADNIIRITGDCPLIDPVVCGEVLAVMEHAGVDYVSNNYGENPEMYNLSFTWPHGLDCEALSFAWLETAAREADKPSEREHVTEFIRKNPHSVKRGLPGPGQHLANHRWTLDTPEDLEFLRKVFDRLPDGAYRWSTVLDVVEGDPRLRATSLRENRVAAMKSMICEIEVENARR